MLPFPKRPVERRCLLAIVILGVGLAGTGLVPTADAGPTEPGDSLTAADVAVHLRYGPEKVRSVSSPTPDRWWGQDKLQHVVVSSLWTLSTQYVLVNKAGWSKSGALPVSATAAAVVGLAKERYDASRPGGTASAKDLVANAVGIGLGIGVIIL